MSLADCFRMELGMVNACFEQGDVREGIRARIVDKDNQPRWNPPRSRRGPRRSTLLRAPLGAHAASPRSLS
jgi:hypothetical protein